MIALLFDTLDFSHKLIDAGMPRKQAEKVAEAQKQVFEAQNEAIEKNILNTMSTKEDIWELKQEIKEVNKRIDFLAKDSKNESSLIRSDFNGKFKLLYWMMGFILAFFVAIAFKLYF